MDLPLEVDLPAVSAVAGVVRTAALDGLLLGVHDVSDGGLAAALGEMVARSDIGMRADGIDGAGELFSEWPGRVVACVAPSSLDELRHRCAAVGVDLVELGDTGGDRLVVSGLIDLSVDAVAHAYHDTLPVAMAAGATH
jgi:phosphoribosylformylglycinamidine synthase